MISLLLQKDEKGMELLLKHYGPLMKYIIAPILKKPQDQEDCLSEVTIRIWNKIEQFDQQRGSWNAWLTSVTRNTALNYARSLARHDAVEAISDTIPAAEQSPEETMVQQEQQEALRRVLQALSSKERMLFYRKYYYLQSTAQIAAELGMTERAVEGKLYRLKRQLRKMLGGEAHE